MTDSPDQKSCSTCGSCWRFPLLLAMVLVAILLVRSAGIRENERPVEDSTPAAAAATGKTVSMAVDFGNRELHRYNEVAWKEGMTIEDLLEVASNVPDGPRFIIQGAGASAFLTRIGDVANEGADGRNWTYSVNGERGDRSFAVYPLEPGDHVLWTFGLQE